MGRPRKRTFSLAEKLARIKAVGIQEIPATPVEVDPLLPLSERVKQLLQIVRDSPVKAHEMTYMILYDITEDKVRTQIAKYLEKQGCIRIQKSVFIARSENPRFQEIHDTLKEVNSYYENQDSILLVPVNASDVRSMKIIGKNLQIEAIVDKPNTLFF
ncbi:MAG: CRISPR-associated endonuclease Cas2 [Lewinellaceae bacterium]|nr:CRISPR-associated endonuclease Cas2 [Lewinellaceae bacterium]